MSLFTRGDQAELAWELLDPILGAWHNPGGQDPFKYEAGGWGPQEADAFLALDGREWLKGCGWHPGLMTDVKR
jgi:glucose-6-phosphate 1-dehydrogenase